MKRVFYLALVMGLAFLCGSCCKDDPQPETPADDSGSQTERVELEPQARPTDWVVVSEGIDPQSTMTADVAINLSHLGHTYESDPQDLMAAFVDGSCRAVAAPWTDEAQARAVFALTIKRLMDEDSQKPVVLKFYSERLHHIFTSATTFAYEGEGRMGTLQQPYEPVWNK